ncbi:MAG: hypothetical protein Hyperionvirus7_24 [Hyperionvirus sp.]|uniref:Uncharacterized protein n=1 Tax=Hyperionvirus sp. TaxID=2487770 RepID=A0A3G5AC54_9VIRU|nr:MAG: hypothetical protein Hyperionvirus7_24 [Hyperionvirus sp.]
MKCSKVCSEFTTDYERVKIYKIHIESQRRHADECLLKNVNEMSDDTGRTSIIESWVNKARAQSQDVAQSVIKTVLNMYDDDAHKINGLSILMRVVSPMYYEFDIDELVKKFFSFGKKQTIMEIYKEEKKRRDIFTPPTNFSSMFKPDFFGSGVSWTSATTHDEARKGKRHGLDEFEFM